MKLAFAIPGDRYRRTGGFIYESAVLDRLRALGHEVQHIQLPDICPTSGTSEIEPALRQLQTVEPNVPLLLDGFIPGVLGADALAKLQAPLFPIIHHPLGREPGLSDAFARHLLARETAALALVDHIIVPSPYTAEILRTAFSVPADRLTIARPGYDGTPLPASPATPPLILSVGLIAERKGHDVLIDALARLPDLPWQAQIIGALHDRALAARLVAQIRRLKLENRISILGQVSDQTLAQSYSAASIFALATRYEGYGIVFGEAMRAGLPIVTCDGGAVRETVAEAGLVGPVDDPAAFASALRQLLTDPTRSRALAEAAFCRGQSLPSWGDTAAKIATAIAETLRP